MEKSGITRRIDDLGRIVIPKEIRKNLKIRDSDEIEINVIDNKIVLNKYESLTKDKVISSVLYTLGKVFNKNVLFTSREKVIDYYIKGKEKIKNKELSINLIKIIENRKIFDESNFYIDLFDEKLNTLISPLIINGDLIGSLIILGQEEITSKEKDVIEIFKVFLENYLE